MRKLRQLSGATVLTLAFAAYGFAGIIPTVPGPDPAPEPPPALATGTIDMPPSEATSVVPVADIALELLLSVL